MALIPIMPLTTVLYPKVVLPLLVCEPVYRRLLRRHRATGKPLGVVLVKEMDGVSFVPYEVGTCAKVVVAENTDGGCYRAVIEGEARFRVSWIDYSGPILRAEVEPIKDEVGDPGEVELLKRRVEEAFRRYLGILEAKGVSPPKELVHHADPVEYSYIVADMLNVDPAEKQRLLSCTSTAQRLRAELELLSEVVDEK